MAEPDRILVGNRRLIVSDHAAERYHERVCPRFETVDEARADLVRVLRAHGRLQAETPEWAFTLKPHTGVVVIGNDIVLPISESGVLSTCLAHGHIPVGLREARNRARRRATAGRRSIRTAKRQHGEGPDYVGGRGI